MATSKEFLEKEQDLDKIEPSAPPTWEEVMAEKKVANDDTEKDTSHKKDKSNKKSSNSTEIMVQSNNIVATNEEAQEPDGNIKAAVRPIVQCFRTFVKTLKWISALTTITSDLLLVVFCLAFIVKGCFIQDKDNFVVKYVPSYKRMFLALSQLLIGVGALYIVLVIPCGLVGVLRHKRMLLKIHNVLLVLSLVGEGILFIFLIQNRRQADGLKSFQKDLSHYYTTCAKSVSNFEPLTCCCSIKDSKKKDCRDYKKGQEPPVEERGKREKYDAEYEAFYKDCVESTDLFKSVEVYMKQAYLFVPFFMITQVTALFFGILVRIGIPKPVYNPEDYIEEERALQLNKRKRNSIFFKVLLFFTVKKGFYILMLFIISTIIFPAFRSWAKTKQLNTGGSLGSVTLWEVISSSAKF